MRRIAYLLIVVSLFSCKTIKVNEKSAFQESRYKFEEFSNYINQTNKSQEEKNADISAIDKVINKNDVLIYNKNGVEL
nr:hypothetical protein [uncultured Flavobacterium sp.]